MLEEQIQRSFDDFINHCSTMPKEVMLRTLRQAHPALQEKFAELVIAWMKDYSENYREDDRNRRTIQTIGKILGAFIDKHGREVLDLY